MINRIFRFFRARIILWKIGRMSAAEREAALCAAFPEYARYKDLGVFNPGK